MDPTHVWGTSYKTWCYLCFACCEAKLTSPLQWVEIVFEGALIFSYTCIFTNNIFNFHFSVYVSKRILPRQGGIQWLRGHNFALFWPPATSTWTFLTLNVDKNRAFLDHLPPLFVHVGIECPPTGCVETGLNKTSCTFSYLSYLMKCPARGNCRELIMLHRAGAGWFVTARGLPILPGCTIWTTHYHWLRLRSCS